MNEPKDDYYGRPGGWAIAQRASDARSIRLAWSIALVAGGLVAMLAVALILLTPLKTVEPVTLLVDRQTGYVQALKPLEPSRLDADAALTQSFLVQYVIAREGFDRATLKRDYRKVASWSIGSARDTYLASMPASNPGSPLNRIPLDVVVEAEVRSVVPIGKDVAQVRFETRWPGRAGEAASSRAWVAIVRYRYSDAPMSMEERFINPLGFQVLTYRRAAEALPTYPERDVPDTPGASIVGSGSGSSQPSMTPARPVTPINDVPTAAARVSSQ